MKINTLIKTALCVSIMCILGPIIIPLPVSPVPISLTHIAIYLSIYILNYKEALLCTIIYILMGLVGLPVFSGYNGGLQTLIGPTGGYLIGFILLTLILGLFINTTQNVLIIILGYIISNMSCYIVGTLWLAYSTHISILNAIIIGVFPYIIGDIIKSSIGLIIGPKISKRIKKV